MVLGMTDAEDGGSVEVRTCRQAVQAVLPGRAEVERACSSSAFACATANRTLRVSVERAFEADGLANKLRGLSKPSASRSTRRAATANFIALQFEQGRSGEMIGNPGAPQN